MNSMMIRCDLSSHVASCGKAFKYLKYSLVMFVPLFQLALADMSYAASRVFYDTFEDGTTNKWVHPGTFPKCIAVSATADGVPIHNGRYAMRCNWYGYGQDEVELSSWPYNNEFFLRWWFKEDANVDHQVGAKTMRLGFGGPDHSYWSCQNEYGDLATMYLYFNVSGSESVYWPSVDNGYCGDHKWHKFELYVKHDTNDKDGIIRFWLDGVKKYDYAGNTHTPGAHWYPWNILSNWSNASQDDLNYTYWDDVEVYSDQGTGAVGSMTDATISTSGSSGGSSSSTLTPPQNLTLIPASN